ncbi:MAG: GNAT family N-acetyltransferase [Candidatus Riflebacteria bacterium]|nr:GNAT family N-acetyltransferase [Candidatus Riflebacteria bacterium]
MGSFDERRVIRTTLTLPMDGRFLKVGRSWVRRVARLAKLGLEQTEALVLAADEAAANILQHAFEPGEEGQISLSMEIGPVAVTLVLKDQGLPFDSAIQPSYHGPEDGQVSRRGLGLHLIRSSVDRVQWYNHGKEGKELRLTMLRPTRSIADQLPLEELTPYVESQSRAPDQSYQVRLFGTGRTSQLRQEAIQVARCAYRTYGYTYAHESLYYPYRIIELNRNGELISAVALTEGDTPEVVGHAAIERPDQGRVAEIGQALVVPAHRSRGILERLVGFLEGVARERQMLGLWATAVTVHSYSQRVTEKLGYRASGVALGLIPASVTFKRFEDQAPPHRENAVIYFKYLEPPPSAVVHAPRHHLPILEEIYAHLGVSVDFRQPLDCLGPGRVTATEIGPLRCGLIRVFQVGSDTAAEIRRALADLREIARTQVVMLDLPLSDPGTPWACQEAEQVGFFFCGLGPHFSPEGDVLRLQYLDSGLGIGDPQVPSPFARRLLEYVLAQRQRVAGARDARG